MIDITISGYTITFEGSDKIWVRKDATGEGMLLNKKQLKALLDKLWDQTF